MWYAYEVFIEQQKYLPQLRGYQEASHFGMHQVFMKHLVCALLRTVDLAVGTIDKVFLLTELIFLVVK